MNETITLTAIALINGKTIREVLDEKNNRIAKLEAVMREISTDTWDAELHDKIEAALVGLYK